MAIFPIQTIGIEAQPSHSRPLAGARRTLWRFVALLGVALLSASSTVFMSPKQAFATAGTGALTVPSTGGDTAPGATWSYDATTGVLLVTGTASVSAVYLSEKLADRNLIVEAASITVEGSISGTSSHGLTLKSVGDISVSANIATQGGHVVLWSDSGENGGPTTAGGSIEIAAGVTINTGTGGGDIVLGGGAESSLGGVPEGYAYGAVSAGIEPWAAAGGASGTAGIMLMDATLQAGTGSVSIRGQGTGGGANFQTGLWLASSSISAGAVTIDGRGSRNSNSGSSNWGVLLLGTTVTSPGNIVIEGLGGTATSGSRTNQHGVVMAPPTGTPSLVEATGSGSVVINGFGGGVEGVGGGAGIVLYDNQRIQSASGDITLEGTSGGLGTFRAVWVLDGTLESSTGNINLVGNANTSSLGGNVTLNTTLAVSGTLSIESPAVVTQTGPITAEAVTMSGPALVTLTNSSNEIGTIAAGSSDVKLGSLSIFDASGGLTIGQVGSLEGITATGDVLVETGDGDITLARSITTDSTSSTAITVNAGKTTAAGDGTGGDIVVSGAPTLTAGTGAIIRMFSGSEIASPGLTSLVGGPETTYFNVDEDSIPDPALADGNAYALYRDVNPVSYPISSYSYTESLVESGKKIGTIFNGGTTTINGVNGLCFGFDIDGTVSNLYKGSVQWGVTDEHVQTNPTDSVSNQYVVLFYDGESVGEPADCNFVSDRSRPNVRSSLLRVYPVGTLSSDGSSATLTANQPMTPIQSLPNAEWPGTLTYSVSPALPAGLSLNSSTGEISGTPSAITATTQYTVTAVTAASITDRVGIPGTLDTNIWDATAVITLTVEASSGDSEPSGRVELSGRAGSSGGGSMTAPVADNPNLLAQTGSNFPALVMGYLASVLLLLAGAGAVWLARRKPLTH